MTPHELRATLDRLDLSAAEAGHLLGVHRATIYRDRRRNRQSRLCTTIQKSDPSQLARARPRLCACLTMT
jgi:IS30 family transposase